MTGIKRTDKITISAAFAVLTFILLAPAAARAQWTQPDATGNTGTAPAVNNVGVGTSAPTAKLDVRGSITIEGTVPPAHAASGYSSLWLKNNVSLMSEFATGYSIVTLGTNYQRSGGVWTSVNTSMPTWSLSMGGGTGGAGTYDMFELNHAPPSGPQQPYTRSTFMVINSSGSVGVGTRTPANALHVHSAILPQAIRVSGVGGGLVNFMDTSAGANQKLYQWRSEGGVFRMSLSNDSESSFAQQNLLVANSSGNVGIGTASPTSKLHLGAGTAQTYITVDGSAGASYNGLAINTDGTRKWYLGRDGADGTDDFILRAGNANVIRAFNPGAADTLVLNSGKVGIGTNPAYKLDVAGQVRSSSGGFVFPDGTTQTTAAAPVTFGSTAGTAVQGNTALTLTAGTGMSGGGTATLGGGGTLTLTNSDRGSSQNIFKSVANAAGAAQFSAGSNTDTLRFEGTGGTTVSFDAANKKVVINSTAGSSGWIDAGSSVTVTSGTAKIGIGTASPVAKLDVSGGYLRVSGLCGGALPNSQGTYLSWNQTCGTGETDLINHQGAGAGGFAFMNTANGSTLTTLMNISGDGDLTVSGNISAKYQDVAEWVPSTQTLPAGTVVVLDAGKTNHVLASAASYDTKVAGVVSARPGISLGEAGEGKVLVATTGRVKVRADATHAPIRVGDLLVTSDAEGLAMRSEPVEVGGRKMHAPGTIIGKALESLASGTGEILVLLSLQ